MILAGVHTDAALPHGEFVKPLQPPRALPPLRCFALLRCFTSSVPRDSSKLCDKATWSARRRAGNGVQLGVAWQVNTAPVACGTIQNVLHILRADVYFGINPVRQHMHRRAHACT